MANGNGTQTTQQLESLAEIATAGPPGTTEDFLMRVEAAAQLLTAVGRELGNVGGEDERELVTCAEQLRKDMQRVVQRMLTRQRGRVGDLERILGKIAG